MKEEKINKTLRKKIIVVFTLIIAIVSYISMRGTYLEKLGIGEEFANIYISNLKGSLVFLLGIFLIIYIYIYSINKGIERGLRPFFEKEKKKLPKLLNKTIAFMVSVIGSIVIMNVMSGNLQLFLSNTYFDIVDPVFNLDISYYMFQKTLIEKLLYTLLVGAIATVVYTVSYYIIVLNRCFD